MSDVERGGYDSDAGSAGIWRTDRLLIPAILQHDPLIIVRLVLHHPHHRQQLLVNREAYQLAG